MLDEEHAAELRGQTLLDASEQEIGSIEEVFLLPADDRPAFAAVRMGDRRVVVPLDEADMSEGRVIVRYDRDAIEGAPDAEGETIDPELETVIYDHYGISDATMRDDTGFAATESGLGNPDTSRDPRGGGGADDATQGHP